MKQWITTWFHADGVSQQGFYANLGGNSSASYFQAVYWRCIVCFFISSIRLNKSAKHVLFTNVEALPEVDGVNVGSLLDKLGVAVVRLEYSHEPPASYSRSWRNQFYVLDCLLWLVNNVNDGDQLGVFDSDAIWLRPFMDASELIRQNGILAYEVPYPIDHEVNGITRREMGDIFCELGLGGANEAPKYFGGEFIVCTSEWAVKLYDRAHELYEQNMSRHSKGCTFLREEAHLLSAAYYDLGIRDSRLDGLMRRVWTSFIYEYNAAQTDLSLMLLHLPAEKRFGFRRLFKKIARGPSNILNLGENDYIVLVKNLFNVPNLSFENRVRNAIEHGLWKTRKIFGA